MVLYKRKPVTFAKPPPIPEDPNTEVFYIKETKEWFLTYEEYLVRRDYYSRRKFVCEITGNSCLTFLEALESEAREIKGVEKNFPEALREHILRFLQFNRITRLDQLVDKVYAVFKNDYFPGETIYIKGQVIPGAVTTDDPLLMHTRLVGVIREKVQYSNPLDGTTTKYLVSKVDNGQQAIVTNDNISRDRNHFTKWLIKTFIKLTMTRSHKVGAPWVVKDKYAKRYRISQEYPEDLRHFADKIDKKKDQKVSLKKKAVLNSAEEARFKPIAPNGILLPASLLAPSPAPANKDPRKRFPIHHLPIAVQQEMQNVENGQAPPAVSFQPTRKNIVDDLHLRFDLQNVRPSHQVLRHPDNSKAWNQKLLKEAQKVADDEMEAEDQNENEPLDDPFKGDRLARLASPVLLSVQESLELWVFLNMYHSVLKLDTFTYDDFLYAMGWTHDQYTELGRCDLLDEVWCALLGAIVSNKIPTNKDRIREDEVFGLLVKLPPKKLLIKAVEVDDDEDRGSDSEHEDKTLKSDVEESDNELPEAKEESQMPEDEDNEEDGSDSDSESVDDDTPHNAYTVMNYRGTAWHERLRRRNFKDGNWQCILLGVLLLVEYVPNYQATIEEVYRVLAPKSETLTPQTVLKNFYYAMDIDLKLRALNILTSLLVNGTLVRSYIDELLDLGSNLRRNRLDNIRDYKLAVEKVQKVHNEIVDRIQAETPDAQARRPRLDFHRYEASPEEAALAERSEEFKVLLEARTEALRQIKELKKSKREIEQKLTEIDCQRVKLLGKDRLYNRYWWFENNGMPSLHASLGDNDDDDDDDDVDDDDDEVLGETYLMGRLWVQGPTNEDLRVNLRLTHEEADTYREELAKAQREVNLLNGNSVADDIEDVYVDLGDGKPPLRQMNFLGVPEAYKRTVAKLYGLSFKEDTIERLADIDDHKLKVEEMLNGDTEPEVHRPNTVIGLLGSLNDNLRPTDLSPIERKVIEEHPDPLFNGTFWRYFDQPHEISQLLQWLSPWGKRESVLRKELSLVRDALEANIEARRNALSLDGTPEDERKLEEQIEVVVQRIHQLESDGVKEEEDDDDVVSRKRPLRQSTAPRKRTKPRTPDETIENGTIEELEELKEKLKVELKEKHDERDLTRVLEWVNSYALDNLDKLLYEGGDKVAKGKPKKTKK